MREKIVIHRIITLMILLVFVISIFSGCRDSSLAYPDFKSESVNDFKKQVKEQYPELEDITFRFSPSFLSIDFYLPNASEGEKSDKASDKASAEMVNDILAQTNALIRSNGFLSDLSAAFGKKYGNDSEKVSPSCIRVLFLTKSEKLFDDTYKANTEFVFIATAPNFSEWLCVYPNDYSEITLPVG